MSADDRAGVETLESENKYSQRPDTLEVFKQDEHPFDSSVTAPSPELRRIATRRMM